MPAKTTVTGHTGPYQFGSSYHQYGKNESTTRLLQINELSNTLECKKYIRSHSLGEDYCARPRCRHEHGVSPAEVAGQDDNADMRVKKWKERLQRQAEQEGLARTNVMEKKKKRLPGARANRKGLTALVTTTVERGYTVPRCNRCPRIAWRFTEVGDHQLAFVHIPKTGGTTIEKHLNLVGGSCHATSMSIQACHPELYASSLSFAVLREPIERTISMYHYTKKGGNVSTKDQEKFAWVQGLDFASFVKLLPMHKEYNFAPQTHFITDENGNINVNKLLCLHTISEEWKNLVEWEPKLADFPTKRLRTSDAADGDMIVDALTEQRLREIYRDDFSLWSKHCGGDTTGKKQD